MNKLGLEKLLALLILIFIGSVIGYYILYMPFLRFGLLYMGVAIGILIFLISLSMMRKASKSSLFYYIFFEMCCIFLPIVGGFIALLFYYRGSKLK